MEDVYVFVDLSNIVYGGRNTAFDREGCLAVGDFRLHVEHIVALARGGRQLQAGFCVGSSSPNMDPLFSRFEQLGFSVRVTERGRSTGTEQGVDEILQLEMMNSMLDAAKPGVAVLMTGDGSGFETGRGFLAALQRMAYKGWGIEVLSWEGACNRHLRTWAEDVGVYVPLDDYYASVTFMEGGRRPRALSLKRRRIDRPVNAAGCLLEHSCEHWRSGVSMVRQKPLVTFPCG